MVYITMDEPMIPTDSSAHEYMMNISTTHNAAVETADDADKVSLPAVISTIVFAIAEIITNGGLLLIFLLRRQTAKHASLIMISTMINSLVSALFDLAMRLPLTIIKEHNLGKTHQHLCMAMTLAPDFWFYAIILCLPLLSVERLVVLETTRSRQNSRQKYQLFISMLVVTYTLALIIAILPTTRVFSAEVNSKCNGSLLYGYRFAHLFQTITALSVTLTAILSIALVFRLRQKLKHLTTTMKKKIVMKQGTLTAIIITAVLFFALVPFAVALQLVLMCGSFEITDKKFCDDTLELIIFRTCVVISRLCLILLPIIFLALNPTLRRKIWLTLRRPKQMENVVTISTNTSMTLSKDSGIMDPPIGEECSSPTDEDGGEFITIEQDLKFGKSGDTSGELTRRQRSIRHRQSVLDLIDVLSVISERSEGTDSGAYSNSEFDDRISDVVGWQYKT